MNALLVVYPILLLVLTFYGAGLTKGGRVSDAFLSLEQTHMIQAFACIGIILHHVTQQVTSYGIYDKGPVTLFNDIGFLFTALFFFFSGYGLLTSLRTKPDYLGSFLYRRLPAVLIPFWSINALGVLLETFAYGIHTTARDVLYDIFGITLISSNGWFFVEITVFYLLFYVFFRLIKHRDAALLLLCLCVAAVIIFSFHQGHDPQGNQAHWFRGEWWYNSTVTFIFGLLTARFQTGLTRFFAKAYIILLPVSALLTALFLQRSIACVRRGGYYLSEMSLYPEELSGSAAASPGISGFVSGLWRDLSSFPSGLSLAARTLLWQSAACIAFTLLIVLLSMKIRLGNRALSYVSTISRELFLIHGYFVSRILGPVRMNDFLRYAAVLASSIAAAAALSPLIRRIVRLVTSGLSKAAGSLSRSLQTAARIKQEEGKKKRSAWKTRILLAALISGLLIVFVLVPVFRNMKAEAEFNSERKDLQSADVGDIVLLGRYESDPAKPGKERVPWTVIRKEKNSALLLSYFGIAPGAYHQKHEAVSWENCDLNARLRSDLFADMFSRYEKEIIFPEGLTLLSVRELKELFPEEKDRVMAATKAAIRQGVNVDRLSHYDIWFDQNYCYSWWWLKQEEGCVSVRAPIVEMDGSLRKNEKAVNKPNGAIRPVVRVKTG